MLRAALFGLIAVVLPTLAVQASFGPGPHWKAELDPTPSILCEEDIAGWGLDEPPNPNATDHLVFETVHSLLQHWPNTRMRNGHNIVPGSIPKGTLLYHGTGRNELPPGPEWVATDPEHSYLFCHNESDMFGREGWHFTLVTTRPLKIVYFDGSSAAKTPLGTLNTQDLIIWGKSRHDGLSLSDERQRAAAFCKWGKNFGVDGFVRMQMDFEVVLCDFASGVSVISSVKLFNGYAFGLGLQILFEVMNAGSWHNRFPGETRVKLDLAALVSFYDTQLAPSLIPIRAGQERWDHRAGNISSEDLSAVKSRLEVALVRPAGLSSGFDWKALFRVIVDRYAQRLELTQYLLNSSATEPDKIVDLTNKTQSQLRIMLTPYLDFSAAPTDPLNKTELGWTSPIFKLCATTHTYSMESEIDSMTDAEKLLLQAVRGTSREICRVVTKMWAAGVYAGIDPLLNTKKSLEIAELIQLRSTWTDDLNQLMAWLDWSVWVKCNPECDPEETCYLPTWPFNFPSGLKVPSRGSSSPSDSHRLEFENPTTLDLQTVVKESLADRVWNTMEPDPDEWIRPQPKCVRRVAPYEF